VNQVAEKILAEVANHGPISFARFMECALYCPVYGYYEKEQDTLGRRGDYYTSLNVGPVFGELLGLQFSAWLDHLRRGVTGQDLSSPLCLVEAGAHRGGLDRDVLDWFKARRPDLYQTLEYRIVEPSLRRQAWQKETLADCSDRVRWVRTLTDARSGAGGFGPVRGVILSNELLDSMPVQRFGWDTRCRAWIEWGVAFDHGEFHWTPLPEPPPSHLVPDLPSQLLDSLPDGFITEVCPTAVQWWTQAAQVLQNGWLITIDYGLTDEELWRPERTGGTLRSYLHHRLIADVLANPGEQDLTAHVNFSNLIRFGEKAGLTTEAFCTQEQFLTRIAAPAFTDPSQLGVWSSERIRQFQTLTHPQHLGRSFRVLVQSRGL